MRKKVIKDEICEKCLGRKKIYKEETKLWHTCDCVINKARNAIIDDFNGIKPAAKGFFLEKYKNTNTIFYIKNKEVFWRHFVHFLMYKVPLNVSYEIITAYDLIDIVFDKHTKFQSYNELYKFDFFIIELELVFQNKNINEMLDQVIGSRTSRKKRTWLLSRHNEYLIKEKFSEITTILEYFDFEQYGEGGLI